MFIVCNCHLCVFSNNRKIVIVVKERFVRFVMLQKFSVCLYHVDMLEPVGPVLTDVKNVIPPVHSVMELLQLYRIYTFHNTSRVTFMIKLTIGLCFVTHTVKT